MRLSHEIIVLDYGDEQTSPFDNPEKTTSENKRDRNDNGRCFALSKSWFSVRFSNYFVYSNCKSLISKL